MKQKKEQQNDDVQCGICGPTVQGQLSPCFVVRFRRFDGDEAVCVISYNLNTCILSRSNALKVVS